MMINHALIMAAGRGSRMMPLTDAIPKPMAPYRGSTLIADGINRIVHRIDHIHVTIGHKKSMLASHVIENGASSILNTEGQSNSWWVYHTLMKYVDEPVLVLTCDNVTDLDITEIEKEYAELGCPKGMLVPVKLVDDLEGDFIHHEGQVVNLVDRHKPTNIYCSGIQILNPRWVASNIKEGRNFYDIWAGLIEARALYVSRKFPKKWFTVDTLKQLEFVNSDRGP